MNRGRGGDTYSSSLLIFSIWIFSIFFYLNFFQYLYLNLLCRLKDIWNSPLQNWSVFFLSPHFIPRFTTYINRTKCRLRKVFKKIFNVIILYVCILVRVCCYCCHYRNLCIQSRRVEELLVHTYLYQSHSCKSNSRPPIDLRILFKGTGIKW